MPRGVYTRTPEHLAKLKPPPGSMLGHHHTEETKKRMSLAKKGKKIGPQTPEHRMKIAEANRGDKCWAWRGGKTAKAQSIRTSSKYREWRRAVFERDGYTCVKCGKVGGELNADHIKPFSLNPEAVFELSNGRTLCKPCHRNTDSYGHKIKLNYVKTS